MKLLLSCEHGGNEIPEEYLGNFPNAEEVLNTHRGFDPGALDLFMHLRSLAVFHCHSTTSRLLVELNRSLHHPNLFSEFTRCLSQSEKKEIIENHYFPYRNEAERKIENWVEEGEKVLHVSVHSFTPVLSGVTRNADIGILFDPARTKEKILAGRWKENLKIIAPHLRVRFNYPYRGTSDGFTTYLRKKFPVNYLGVELEVNQKYSEANKMNSSLKSSIFKVLQEEIKRRQKEL